jgi:hypothetical protein
MKNITIGITMHIKKETNLWANGIGQNAINLIKLLKKSSNNYKIVVLNSEGAIDSEKEKPDYLRSVDILDLNTSYNSVDLMIVFSWYPTPGQLEDFKKSKSKRLVSYKCGNDIMYAMESMIFDQKTTVRFDEQVMDEIWYIPQNNIMNRDYYSITSRKPSIPIPFIWNPGLLDNELTKIDINYYITKKGKKNKEYQPWKHSKSIGIMEPNLNTQKTFLVPALIAEECYRMNQDKSKIDKVYITNMSRIKENRQVDLFLKPFDLDKDKKIRVESRYQTSYILSQYFDILVCHQLQDMNALNYLYLDAIHMGYPVLHNAMLCKDLGYYYERNNIKEAASMLDYIIHHHDEDLHKYNAKNRAKILRYHSDNPALVETYDTLISNLWKKGNSHLDYNVEKNLYYNL